MKIIAIILARGGSKGIPKKNIKLINDIPLIAYTIKQCFLAGIKEIYTSSDDHQILSIAKSYGSKEILRPSELASSTSTSEEAWIHAIKEISSIDYEKDWIFAPQITSPLREPEDIKNACNLAATEKHDSILSVVAFDDFFLWENKNKKVTPINHDFKFRKRRQDIETKTLLENGSLYMFKPKGIMKANNRLHGNIGCVFMEKYKMFQIDEEEDLALAEYFINKHHL